MSASKSFSIAKPASAKGGDIARDNDLMTQIAAGCHDAFSEFYDRHASQAYGLALRVVGNSADAEAVLSDVFLEIWRHPQRFDGEVGAGRTYLLMLTRCRAIDRLRANSTRLRIVAHAAQQKEDVLSGVSAVNTPAETAQTKETHQIVRQALTELGDEQRLSIELAFFEGLTHRQVAERLGVPIGTVKTRIRLGLAKLRGSLVRERKVDHAMP